MYICIHGIYIYIHTYKYTCMYTVRPVPAANASAGQVDSGTGKRGAWPGYRGGSVNYCIGASMITYIVVLFPEYT